MAFYCQLKLVNFWTLLIKFTSRQFYPIRSIIMDKSFNKIDPKTFFKKIIFWMNLVFFWHVQSLLTLADVFIVSYHQPQFVAKVCDSLSAELRTGIFQCWSCVEWKYLETFFAQNVVTYFVPNRQTGNVRPWHKNVIDKCVEMLGLGKNFAVRANCPKTLNKSPH